MNAFFSTLFLKLFSLKLRKSFYKDSDLKDIHGNKIIEGSIISFYFNNKRCGLLPCEDKNDVRVVEYGKISNYRKAKFTCNCYGLRDPLNYYDDIRVLGHVEEYRGLYNENNISGNFGKVLK